MVKNIWLRVDSLCYLMRQSKSHLYLNHVVVTFPIFCWTVFPVCPS